MNKIRKLIEGKRIIICVGSGGVGKTTTSSALGIFGTLLGKKTLCITVDPAKRLKDALKLNREEGEEEEVSLEEVGFTKMPLYAMVLNTKKEMDRIINKYLNTEEEKRRILNHRFYEKTVTSLVGTMEYVSMEKLFSLRKEGKYDLIILDTPPSMHAIDFFQAPMRIAELVKAPVFRLIAKAKKNFGEIGLKFLKWRRIILRGLQNFIDRYTFFEILELLFSFNSIFGAYEEHQIELLNILKSPDVTFIVVANPQPSSLSEATFLISHLRKEKAQISCIILNRIHPEIEVKGRESFLMGKIINLVGEGFSRRLFSQKELKSYAKMLVETGFSLENIARIEGENIKKFQENSANNIPLIKVPLFDSDICSIEGLLKYLEFL